MLPSNRVENTVAPPAEYFAEASVAGSSPTEQITIDGDIVFALLGSYPELLP